MSLIQEIKNTLLKPDCDLPSLLLKCKLLSNWLDNDELKSWCENEIKGYKDIKTLPDYRVIPVQSTGTFLGDNGQLIEKEIVLSGIHYPECREELSHSYMDLSITALKQLYSEAYKQGGYLKQDWEEWKYLAYSRLIYDGFVCKAAHKIIPLSSVDNLFNEVKNRMLDFILKIEKEEPNINNEKNNQANISQEKITQTFNTTIYGSAQNLAIGNHSVTQIINNSELFDNLVEAAKKIQEESIFKEFIGHIENMKNANNHSMFKSSYKSFIESLANHATVASFFTPFLSSLSQLL